jgi:hypothetical protein
MNDAPYTPRYTPEVAIEAARQWQYIKDRYPTIARGILEGKTRKEIAASMKWDVRSLNNVIRNLNFALMVAKR